MTPEEFLSDASSPVAGEAVEIRVRDLLAIWGHVTRGPTAVAEIGEALADAALITDPDFRTVADMRDTVRVRPDDTSQDADQEAPEPEGDDKTADLSERFAMLAGPFLLISEIERRIRRQIDNVCALADIQSAASSNPARPRTDLTSVHALTFGACRHVLMKQDIWRRLGWDIDHQLFLDDLKEVNGIRNEVMHFRPDPLTPQQIAALENFAKWLRRLDPLP